MMKNKRKQNLMPLILLTILSVRAGNGCGIGITCSLADIFSTVGVHAHSWSQLRVSVYSFSQ